MNQIKENIEIINKNIKNSIKKSNIKDKYDIILLAVTKTVECDTIIKAIECGITDIGENKPQELSRKYDIIGNNVRWHLIGSLQTNKVKSIIDKVYMIHSLDRISLCEEIQKRAKKDINCLVQVNITKEETKSGLYKEDVINFIKCVSRNYPKIKIKGLMTMAPFTDDEDILRRTFRELKDLSDTILSENIDSVSMDYLSMGMSNDYEIAIEEGANIVRIGTSIFGKRNLT